MFCSRAENKKGGAPTIVIGVPIEQELDGEDEELGDGGAVCSDDSSGSADDRASRGAGDMDLSSGDENKAPSGAYPPVLGKVCGRLPVGFILQEYLLRPPNTDRKGADGVVFSQLCRPSCCRAIRSALWFQLL